MLHFSQRDGHETESYGEQQAAQAWTAPQPTRRTCAATNVLAKLGWNYTDDARLGLTYEHYKDDRDTDQKSAVRRPVLQRRPDDPRRLLGGIYQWRTGNDTITRERFGLEHSFALDSLLADNIKWTLNYQIAKTDQSTEEIYDPITRTVLRNRDTTYKDRQWVFDAQAGQGVCHR